MDKVEKHSETELKITRPKEEIISKDDIIRRIESHQKEMAMLQGLIDADEALLGDTVRLKVKTSDEVKLSEKITKK